MQTRKFGLRALTLAMASVLTLGLAACEETKTVTPLDPTVLEVSPTGPLTLTVGDRVQFVANLRNQPAGATITWASSNTAVATVDGNGNVEAKQPGQTTITASAPNNAGGTERFAVAVTVVAKPTTTPPADTTRASVTIEAILDTNDTPVNPDSIRGTVYVRLDVERGNADSLVVSLNGTQANAVVCTQRFNAAATSVSGDGLSAAQEAQATLVCPINTARFTVDGDPNTGRATATFRNGPAQITARLFRGNQQIAAASTGTLTLRNRDVVRISVGVTNADGPQRAIDPRDNELWVGGSVTLTGQPVVYSGLNVTGLQGNAQLFVFDYEQWVNSGLRSTTLIRVIQQPTVATANGGFTATFSETVTQANGGVADVEDLVLPFIMNLSTAGGQTARLDVVLVESDFQAEEPLQVPNTQTFANYFRLDNQAPDAADALAFLTLRPLFTGGAVFINETFSFDVIGANRRPITMMPSPFGERPIVNRLLSDTIAARALVQGSAATVALDEGVNNVVDAYFAGTSATPAALFTAANRVTSGADAALNPQTERSDEFVLGVQLTDALGNTTRVIPQLGGGNARFGVDRIDPRIVFTTGSIANQAINPAGSFLVTVSDSGVAGGFQAGTRVARRVRRYFAPTVDSRVFECGPTVQGGLQLPGEPRGPQAEGTRCFFDTEGAGLATSTATTPFYGYYTFDAFAVDQAGNRSEATVSRTIIVDDQAPVVRNVNLPTSFTAGQPVDVVGDFQDNLDLFQQNFREFFPESYGVGGLGANMPLPINEPQLIDDRFDVGQPLNQMLITTASSRADVPFIRSFEIFTGPGAGTPSAPNQVGFLVQDAALNFGTMSRPISSTLPAGFVSTATQGIATFEMRTVNSTTGPNFTLNARVTGTSAEFNVPFNRVAFYFIRNGEVFFIGNATSSETTAAPGEPVRADFFRNFTLPAGIASGQIRVFAVGFTSAADALGTSNTQPATFTNPS